MVLYSMVLWLLWLSVVAGEVASSHDITQINSLGGPEGRLPSIDPRLRRALLRVLTRLEDEDRQTNQDSARQMAEAMQNIVSEQDFIRFFQEQGLEKELLESYDAEQKNKEDQMEHSNYGEILSYSSEDEKKNSVTPFTFASYPEDKAEATSETHIEYQKNKYPATNPTPSLGDAVYFQIPEPVHFSESSDNEDKPSFNVQETRSIQGPTLVSPTENGEYQTEKVQEEHKLNFITEDYSEKVPSEKDQASNIIRVAEPENIDSKKEDDDDPKTEFDFHASNGTEIEDVDESGNTTMKVNLEKHEVEFLHSSLLAAFTVQQDQQGLPRRVIPLNYQASGDPIPLPKNKEQLRDKQNLVDDKHKQLELQVKFLQEQQLQEEQYQRLQEFVKERQRLLDDESQRQKLLDNQKRLLENDQRLAVARQRQQQILFQNQQFDNQLDTLKELERQRLFQQQQQQINYQQQQFHQPQNFQQQNFQQQQSFQSQPAQQESFQQQPINQQSFKQQPVQQQSFQQQPVQQQSFQAFQHQTPQAQPQHVHFQKSVDFQFQTNQQQPQTFTQSFFQPSFNSAFQPSVQLNRVNRHEPSNSIGNFGLSTPQPSLNFHSSGVSTVHNFIQPTHSSFSASSNYLQPQFHHRFSTPRPPLTVDSQIQSLLSISGISQDLRSKPSAQEDLNIVSKVLALGHGDQYKRQQFQASNIHEQFVLPPSRVIEPPKL